MLSLYGTRPHGLLNKIYHRGNEEAFMLSNLKISDSEGHPPAATSWIARTTRSIFGKSKSCTDLRDLQLPLATQVS